MNAKRLLARREARAGAKSAARMNKPVSVELERQMQLHVQRLSKLVVEGVLFNIPGERNLPEYQNILRQLREHCEAGLALKEPSAVQVDSKLVRKASKQVAA